MPGNSSRSKGKRSCRCFEQSLGTFKCPKFQALIFGIFETSTQTSPKHPKGTFTIGTPRRRYYRSASRNVPRLVIFQPSSGRIGQTFANKIRESPSWRQTSWSLDYKSFLVVGKLSQSMLAAWVSLVAGLWGWQSSTSTYGHLVPAIGFRSKLRILPLEPAFTPRIQSLSKQRESFPTRLAQVWNWISTRLWSSSI